MGEPAFAELRKLPGFGQRAPGAHSFCFPEEIRIPQRPVGPFQTIYGRGDGEWGALRMDL